MLTIHLFIISSASWRTVNRRRRIVCHNSQGFFSHKTLQHVKKHFNYSSSKNLKTVIKYIALNPAGVVQHIFIAGSCHLS